MKILLCCLSAALFASQSWIQVLSVHRDAVVAPALLQRIEQQGFSYEVMKEGDTQKVWLGSFGSVREAKRTLPMVRCKIASDAFVVRGVSGVEMVPGVEVVPESMAVIAQGSEKRGNASSEKKMHSPVTKEEKVTTQMSEPCICVYDKKSLRKVEIGIAMDFYRNSPDYRFTDPEEE